MTSAANAQVSAPSVSPVAPYSSMARAVAAAGGGVGQVVGQRLGLVRAADRLQPGGTAGDHLVGHVEGRSGSGEVGRGHGVAHGSRSYRWVASAEESATMRG